MLYIRTGKPRQYFTKPPRPTQPSLFFNRYFLFAGVAFDVHMLRGSQL